MSLSVDKLDSIQVEVNSLDEKSKSYLGLFTIPKDVNTKTERKLSSRQAQLLAMSSCIGTAVFISMGGALTEAGPAGIFIAYTLWCTVVYGTNCTLSEMTIYLPIDSSWIVYITRWVEESIGVGNAWQFIIGEATLVCYEITAFSVIIEYWVPDIESKQWISITVILIAYVLIQCLGVNYYGEIEFWLAIGKVLLAVMMILYTFLTMVGANPERWVYGFTYWKNPGSFVDFQGNGTSTSYFEGFIQALIYASFTVSAPDYVAMTAGELSGDVRNVLKKLFRTVLIRLFLFFSVLSLCVGIICPYNADSLLNGSSKSARSPYVISMQILHIKGLPDFFTAILCTSVFSSGNGFFYCSTRSLYGLAQEGKAPKFFKICLKNGAPIGAIIFISAVSCLSFLALGSGSAKVLGWFTSISNCSLMIYMTLINVAYLRFRQGLKAQGIDYHSLPYTHPLSEYIVYYSLIMNFVMLFLQGYYVFKVWDTATFIFNYFMLFFTIAVAIIWKIYKRPKFLKPSELDLVSGKKEVDDYIDNYMSLEHDKDGFFRKIVNFVF